MYLLFIITALVSFALMVYFFIQHRRSFTSSSKTSCIGFFMLFFISIIAINIFGDSKKDEAIAKNLQSAILKMESATDKITNYALNINPKIESAMIVTSIDQDESMDYYNNYCEGILKRAKNNNANLEIWQIDFSKNSEDVVKRLKEVLDFAKAKKSLVVFVDFELDFNNENIIDLLLKYEGVSFAIIDAGKKTTLKLFEYNILSCAVIPKIVINDLSLVTMEDSFAHNYHFVDKENYEDKLNNIYKK